MYKNTYIRTDKPNNGEISILISNSSLLTVTKAITNNTKLIKRFTILAGNMNTTEICKTTVACILYRPQTDKSQLSNQKIKIQRLKDRQYFIHYNIKKNYFLKCSNNISFMIVFKNLSKYLQI